MHLSVGQIHKLICTEFIIVIRECNSTRCNFYQQEKIDNVKSCQKFEEIKDLKNHLHESLSTTWKLEDLKDSEFIIINSKNIPQHKRTLIFFQACWRHCS